MPAKGATGLVNLLAIASHSPASQRIKDAVSTSERPASIGDRSVSGYWESGLISDAKNSHIAMHVDCHSRYVIVAKVPEKPLQFPDMGSR